MRLVYPVSTWLHWSLTLPLIFLLRIPEDCLVKQTLHVLFRISCPGGHSVHLPSVSFRDATLVLRIVTDNEVAFLGFGEDYGPHTEVVPSAFVAFPVPLVELTKLDGIIMNNKILLTLL
jgi:hypothetical protein